MKRCVLISRFVEVSGSFFEQYFGLSSVATPGALMDKGRESLALHHGGFLQKKM